MNDTCFVIMPFQDIPHDYYKDIIKLAVQESGLSPIRADEIYGTQSIIEDIVQQISSSKLLIADLTYRNPNVMYELGVAHSLNKPVIMLVQNTNDIPFDLKHLRVIVYDTTKIKWSDELKTNIKQTISVVLKNPKDSKPFDIEFVTTEIGASMKKMLVATTQDFKLKLSITEDIIVDEKGNCELRKKRNVIALSDITHGLFETYIDKPGKIVIEKVFDEQLKKDIEFITYEESELSHSFFIIFDDVKRKGSVFNYIVNLRADNYLSDIVDKGVGYRRIFGYFQTRIESVRENYFFPDIPIYESLQVSIYKHPINEMIGKKILPEKSNGFKVYRINHDNLINHTPEIEIKFELTSYNNV